MAVNSRVKSSSKVRMEAGPFESHKITDTSAEGRGVDGNTQLSQKSN